MKVTDKAIEIAQVSLKLIIERLSQRAKEEVTEHFCKEKCGHSPEGNFCPDAFITYGELLKHLFMEYSRLN